MNAGDDERAVLGDELQQRGDPQGELIGLMLAQAALPVGAPVARRNLIESKIAALLDTHHDALYGVLAPHVTRLSRPDLLDPALIVKKWDGGFADTIWIQRRYAGIEIADVIRALRTLPIARFVRRLEIGGGDHPAAIDELVREPLPALRELVVSDQTRQLPKLESQHVKNTFALEPLLARLEVVELLVAAEYTRFESPTLKTLKMHRPWAPDYAEPTVRFDARLPVIEDVALSQFKIDREFFDRYPTLRSASLTFAFDDGWLEHFVRSGHVDHVESLTVAAYNFPDSQLEAVVRNAGRIEKMKLFDLSLIPFSLQAREAARPRLPPHVKLA